MSDIVRRLSKAVHIPTNGDRKHSTDLSSPTSTHSSHHGHTHSNSPHRKSLAQVLHLDREPTASSSDNDSASEYDSDGMSNNARKRLIRKQKNESKMRHSIDSREESEERLLQRMQEIKRNETPEMSARYGDMGLMQSKTRDTDTRIHIDTISKETLGKEVCFRARLHHVRAMGPKLVFLIFRQQIHTIQGVLVEDTGKVSAAMLHWAEHLRSGNIMLVKGIVQEPTSPVKATSIHDVELGITFLKVIVRRAQPVPFSVQEAELAIHDDEHKVEGRQSQISDRTRLANRIMDLRTSTSQSIFRIQSGVGNMFRTTLDGHGFIEIHTPKLQPSATESGSSVFHVNYFGREATLAQSPQLGKQMAMASDFERVYEVGAVFRAENSNTHRHLTEYTGLDLEMVIEEHYHEALDIIDETLKTIFRGIYTKYRKEVDFIKTQFPSEDLVILDETPRIPFKDAVKLLNDSGWRNEEGEKVSDLEDLATRDEIRVGELIKEHYKTDFYILDKFPRSARPFYTMPDPTDDRYTNSFDIFVRGQEIISGGQRIHESKFLEDNMIAGGVDPSMMTEYLEGFKWGAPPHAGCGIGLERIVMLVLKLGNIRLASMFFRDPKSFPPKPIVIKLPHPDADTLHPAWKRTHDGSVTSLHDRKMPPIEDLIANYGDATTTSWGDDRYKIWRHAGTGAAVSYVPEGSHAILPGDPLCDPSQYYLVASSFLTWLKKETKLKPIWILCGAEMEEVLGERLGWRTLSCVSEERVDTSVNKAESDPEVSRKIRKAQAEGLKITDIDFHQPVPQDIKTRAEARVKDWLANRKGTQIHLSNIDLFRDERHRRYFVAEDKDGTLCGIAVLAQLAPRHGYQAKYCLDFPGAPSGTIELVTTHAISAAAQSGIKNLTFGGGAAAHLTPGHHLHGAKVKLLSSTYDGMVKQFHLNRKTEFRSKMGATEDPSYICWPSHGLGSKGIRAIMAFFKDE